MFRKVLGKLSIRKRLLISNIAMVLIPVLSLFLVELLLGIGLIYVFKMDINEQFEKTFLILRFAGLLSVLIITNGVLTYYISKSILLPIRELSIAAEQISDGNLEYSINPSGKDELGKLAETFELMRGKLQESADLKVGYEINRKELIANISHDLKTPITSIKGYVEGIQDGVANTPEKLERYLQTIYTKANDMDHLIDELFLYSKLDLHSVPFKFEKVNLQSYLENVIEEIQFDLEKNGVGISLFVEHGKSFEGLVDREQLKRVISNIINNSLKFMDKDEKRIEVYVKMKSKRILVEIKDNGSGIPKENLPNVFDQFYKADLSRNSENGGSGLGLAIVKRIIEEHGGEVMAESKEGEGTSIFFTIKNKSGVEGEINHAQSTNY